MIGEALYAYLTAQPAITALASTRIFPGIAPDATAYPLVQWTRISEDRLAVLDGTHDVKHAVFQIDAWARQGTGQSTHVTQAEALADAIEAALDRFVGYSGQGVEVRNCHLVAGRGPLFEEDGTLARYGRDYDIRWRAL